MRVDVLRHAATDSKGNRDEDGKEEVMPPGAAPSWSALDNDKEQTTSKPTDVIIVTSPVC